MAVVNIYRRATNSVIKRLQINAVKSVQPPIRQKI